jgi:succinate-semialdehyde dehydrogenase/glutarate-semialdehyde dehydrogenase
VLADVSLNMPVLSQEILGPVAAVIPIKDEVSTIANCARFGLEAGNWSHNANRALTLGRRFASGARGVNAVVASDWRLPFGDQA